MAEINHSEKEGIGMGVGMIFLLIVLGLFIIWVLTGGPSGSKSVIKTTETEKSAWPASNEIPSYGSETTN